ncbi:hypothetical protein [Amycolatopsis minnesotensis]|uniref:hypothetical protein n=1 Tax=Amycolatopsis minnesotensis TaxID=337894 RepID=UPI0031DA68BA
MNWFDPWLGDSEINVINDKIATFDKFAAFTGRSDGFTLDRDEAHEILNEATRIRNQLNLLQMKANRLEHLSPPADDPASLDYNDVLTSKSAEFVRAKSEEIRGRPGAFAFGAGHVTIEVNYLTELIGRLRKSLGIKDETEEQNKQRLQSAQNADKQNVPQVGKGGGYA